MFGDSDSAIDQFFILQGWNAARLYRNRPVRIMPRNYHLPDFLSSNNADLLAEPIASEADMPRKHSVEPIDSGADAAPPVVTEGDPRRESDASESDFTRKSTGAKIWILKKKRQMRRKQYRNFGRI